ncbi:MAG TPA: hypothetical protein EYP56_04195 [Planctomycetaceae bacterium]|nr:hypothetical protein [Planctomycetaceae bacterium]HIQ21336.1 hypothetical protein [Planctomycetota bacterium]
MRWPYPERPRRWPPDGGKPNQTVAARSLRPGRCWNRFGSQVAGELIRLACALGLDRHRAADVLQEV